MKPIEWRPAARRDVAEGARWHARKGGLALGERFLAQVHVTLELIGRYPASGSPRHERVMPDLPEPLRFFPVRGFETYLVYYIELPDQVEVLRIWNAARGLDALMADDR